MLKSVGSALAAVMFQSTSILIYLPVCYSLHLRNCHHKEIQQKQSQAPDKIQDAFAGSPEGKRTLRFTVDITFSIGQRDFMTVTNNLQILA